MKIRQCSALYKVVGLPDKVIKEVFLHCAKALMRSDLWSSTAKVDRSTFPTMGQMINDQLSLSETAESQEDMVDRYKRDL